MNFEEALVEELGAIDGLQGKIYPLNAAEGDKPPFVIYVSSEGEQTQSLEGYADLKQVTCQIHVITDTYDTLKSLTKSVMSTLKTFYARPIGTNGPVIKSLMLTEPIESFEEEVSYARCSFDVIVRL